MSRQNDGLPILVSDLSSRSEEWRETRRSEAMAITCPSCKALPLFECVTKTGAVALVIHVRRYDKENFRKPDEKKPTGLQLGMPW